LRAKETLATITNTIEKLREERAGLRVALTEERRYITKDLRSINSLAKDTITRLKEDLSSGINEGVAKMNKLNNLALLLPSPRVGLSTQN